MSEPRYLVQTSDGVLHAYFNAEILRIDLSVNKGESVKLFERVVEMGRISYVPITIEQVRAA
jgi:hypothetical protein